MDCIDQKCDSEAVEGSNYCKPCFDKIMGDEETHTTPLEQVSNRITGIWKEKFTNCYQQVPIIEHDPRVFVLASDYCQAMLWMKDMGYDKGLLRYVESPRNLEGIDGNGKTLYIYGTAYRQRDYRDIIARAEFAGFRIEGVS